MFSARSDCGRGDPQRKRTKADLDKVTVSTALNLARSDDREDQRRSLVELQSLKDHRLTDTELARIVESIDALPPDHRVELLVILARQGTAETLESFAALIRAETERDDIFFPRWRAIGALRDLAAHHGLVLDVLLDGIIGSQSHDDAALLNRWITQGLLDDAGLRTVVARLSIEVTGASEIARQRLADAARRGIGPDRLVVCGAVVVAGQPEANRRPENEKGRRERKPAGPPAGPGPKEAVR